MKITSDTMSLGLHGNKKSKKSHEIKFIIAVSENLELPSKNWAI